MKEQSDKSGSRLTRMLERLRDDAVMSKFASQRDCEVYRSAIGDMLNMVRGEGWTLDPSPSANTASGEVVQLLRDIQSNMASGEPEWSTIESRIEGVLRSALSHEPATDEAQALLDRAYQFVADEQWVRDYTFFCKRKA
jgi:hypothetical protein